MIYSSFKSFQIYIYLITCGEKIKQHRKSGISQRVTDSIKISSEILRYFNEIDILIKIVESTKSRK